jgi:hypothetical protein
MIKSASKTGTASSRKITQDESPRSSKPSVPTGRTFPAQTKQAKIVAMLRSPVGTTIAAVVKVTGWQQHSVRGFFAGVVRKKLKLNLVSEPSDKGRVYRISERRLKPGVARTTRAA